MRSGTTKSDTLNALQDQAARHRATQDDSQRPIASPVWTQFCTRFWAQCVCHRSRIVRPLPEENFSSYREAFLGPRH